MSGFLTRLATVIGVGLFAFSPKSALACDYGYCWGAVGFGPLGAAGYASGVSNAMDAEQKAQAACGDKCSQVEVFNDSCGAIAADRDGASQFGTGVTRATAEAASLENCRALGLYCNVRASVCSLPN